MPQLRCTGIHHNIKDSNFSWKGFSASLLMTAQLILIATNMMHVNNQCQQSNFCLKTGFFAKSDYFIGQITVWLWSRALPYPCKSQKTIIWLHSFYQSLDGLEPIPRVAIMPLDDKIRFHKLVIMHAHELNYPILKRDMGITHWKVELSRKECRTKA